MSEALTAIGRNIRAERTRLGWTRERLAEECGVGYWRLTSLERGKCSARLDELFVIAKSLGVTPESLIHVERIAA